MDSVNGVAIGLLYGEPMLLSKISENAGRSSAETRTHLGRGRSNAKVLKIKGNKSEERGAMP